MAASSKIHTRRWGVAVGLAMTGLGFALWAVNLLDPLDHYALDLHFRHLSTVDPDPRIVLVDINDHALTAVHPWPWPRRVHAQLVQMIDELGTRAIVLDVGFFDRSAPRVEHAGLGPYYDVDAGLLERGDRSADRVIYDDNELLSAIARAGNVYLAMLFRLSPPRVDPPALLERALELVRSRPDIPLDRFRTELSLPPPWDSERFHHQVRLATLLEQDFSLDVEDLSRKLDPHAPMECEVIEEHLLAAKQLVARGKAARFVAEHPELAAEHPEKAWPAFFASALPGQPFDALAPDRSELLSAFLTQSAGQTIVGSGPPVPPSLRGRIPHAYDLTVPLDKLARAAEGVGFVAFERNRPGGVVRALPLVVDTDGTLLMQLGLLAAMDVLGIDRAAIAFEKGRLVIGTGPGARRLPLDENGATLLNWHVPHRPDRWVDSFDHIPVARIMEIVDNRKAIADNQRRLGIGWGELVAIRHHETPAEYADYVRLVNRRLGAREPLGDEQVSQGRRLTEEELDRLDGAIFGVEEDAVVWLRRVWGLWEREEPRSEEERAERETLRRLYENFGAGQLEARFAEAKQKLLERNRALIDELRPRLAGKVCLVGYTASAVPDLVTTPVYTSAPGVMVHANVINLVLQNHPAVSAAGWLNGLMILLGGLVITVVTSARGPLVSLGAMLALMGLTLSAGVVAFWVGPYYIASVVASALIGLTWASVTVYRQFTEERARRQFHRALAQYTSPAVAARIAESASFAGLAPRPAQVTCFFSDLERFTELSERLGAARTRLVLNPYLGAVSRVLMDHNAMVNKFMGDGIFAFFNAPVWPCADHCEAACAGAVAAQRALAELNGRRAAGVRPLVMRIGLSTGEAFVGDYGSDTKLDYTCIGDTVNLGARLEQANKAFATAVLVDEATRQGAGNRFVFRRLGRIVVEGKAAPVAVHELVGAVGAVDERALAYVARFDRAVQHFQHCEWDYCAAILRDCRALRPDDHAVAQYEAALARHRATPAPATWNGAIELAFMKR